MYIRDAFDAGLAIFPAAVTVETRLVIGFIVLKMTTSGVLWTMATVS